MSMVSIICPSVKRLPSMKCVRSCDQQPLKQKKVFALKRSLIPRGFIYSSNMAHSLLFTPPTWWTWCHENILYWVTTSQIIKIKINCPPSPSFARFCESRISSQTIITKSELRVLFISNHLLLNKTPEGVYAGYFVSINFECHDASHSHNRFIRTKKLKSKCRHPVQY